ncbi:cupin domain-containing protein [Halarcobacter sp.]|uniref:cupin domain-containing protein n=1 Tax=Halarcobacter sp. TaxID=2321133 RepID=UPI0029F498C6|nr:cupin domain-containing protein [Halarcobacter sp.]
MLFDNIYDDILIDKKNEQFIDLIKNENVRIEKIVSNGQCSPKDFWYSQDENEFVIILKGEAILEFENEKVPMLEGDYINIPSKRKHRVEYTLKDEPTIWLAVFY